MLQSVTLILLINLICMFSTGKFESSCSYEAVGGKVVISFDDVKVQEGDELRWTHNERRVYFKKRSQVRIKEFNVGDDGSLILENIRTNNSGEYKGIIYDAHGKLRKQTVKQLCVLEPVPEPTIKFECLENGVNLTCSSIGNDEVVVSWIKNDITTNTARAILHVISSEVKPGDRFSCTFSNQISKKSAKEVEPACSETGLNRTTANHDKEKEVNSSGNENKKSDDVFKKKFLGLELWLMLVILIGGGSFLILFIICLVCFCRCYRRNQRKAKEEEELRLTNLIPDHPDPPDVQYMQQMTSQRSFKSQRPLPPLPSHQGPPCVGPT